MTLSELGSLLETTGYPVAYRSFSTTKTPPFICYLSPYSRNFAADNKVHQKIDHVQIELYTKTKNTQAETKLENVLDGADLFYDKTETHIDAQEVYQIIYDCEVT